MKIANRDNTTLYDIIQSELINKGFNEFSSKNKLEFFNNDKAFIKKVLKYDSDVEEILNRMVFQGEKVESNEGDKHFKKTFINKFMNRTLGRQTIEDFSSQVLFTFLLYKDYINLVYDEMDDFLKGKGTSDSESQGNSISDNRTLSSDLPRNEINLNVDDTVLNYGNQNVISRNKSVKDDDSQSVSYKYSIDDLLKVETLLRNVFNEFDKNCFIQAF